MIFLLFLSLLYSLSPTSQYKSMKWVLDIVSREKIEEKEKINRKLKDIENFIKERCLNRSQYRGSDQQYILFSKERIENDVEYITFSLQRIKIDFSETIQVSDKNRIELISKSVENFVMQVGSELLRQMNKFNESVIEKEEKTIKHLIELLEVFFIQKNSEIPEEINKSKSKLGQFQRMKEVRMLNDKIRERRKAFEFDDEEDEWNDEEDNKLEEKSEDRKNSQIKKVGSKSQQEKENEREGLSVSDLIERWEMASKLKQALQLREEEKEEEQGEDSGYEDDVEEDEGFSFELSLKERGDQEFEKLISKEERDYDKVISIQKGKSQEKEFIKEESRLKKVQGLSEFLKEEKENEETSQLSNLKEGLSDFDRGLMWRSPYEVLGKKNDEASLIRSAGEVITYFLGKSPHLSFVSEKKINFEDLIEESSGNEEDIDNDKKIDCLPLRAFNTYRIDKSESINISS